MHVDTRIIVYPTYGRFSRWGTYTPCKVMIPLTSVLGALKCTTVILFSGTLIPSDPGLGHKRKYENTRQHEVSPRQSNGKSSYNTRPDRQQKLKTEVSTKFIIQYQPVDSSCTWQTIGLVHTCVGLRSRLCHNKKTKPAQPGSKKNTRNEKQIRWRTYLLLLHKNIVTLLLQ